MVLGALVQAAFGLGDLVASILEAKGRSDYYKALKDPPRVLSSKDLEAQRKHDIDPYYLINQPQGTEDAGPKNLIEPSVGAYRYTAGEGNST